MAEAKVSRPAGRPKSEGKRAAIVAAARELFLGNAYESVTMDKVARVAGVAKMTVYGHFRDKEQLFEAMVRAMSDTMAASLPERPRRDGPLEEELVAFGCAFLGVISSPDISNAVQRHFEMLSRNRPLAERFYNAGPGRTEATLAAYLAPTAGWTDHPDLATQAASDLMSLWVGKQQQMAALGLADPISPEAIEQHVRRCTQLFMRAYGLASAAPAAR